MARVWDVEELLTTYTHQSRSGCIHQHSNCIRYGVACNGKKIGCIRKDIRKATKCRLRRLEFPMLPCKCVKTINQLNIGSRPTNTCDGWHTTRNTLNGQR